MGGALFHLLPESLEEDGNILTTFVYVIVGFSLFFIMERLLRWHHCHDKECKTHAHVGSLNLIGDTIHNIIDWIFIYSTFSVSPELGIPVALSIIVHEIPQEIGDFGVLLYSGFKKSKALLYNFLVALTTILGVIIGFFLLESAEGVNLFLLPFAAGGFIYIAASDLIPEIHKEPKFGKSMLSFSVFVLALVLMYLLKLIG